MIRRWRNRGIEVKTPAQVDSMRQAGLVVARTLEHLRGVAQPGLTTAEVDAAAEALIREQGATPSFLGYQGFSGSVCISVNEEVVHGVPGSRALREGDLVSLDCGAILDGWHGDAAVTFPLGAVGPDVAALVEATEAALAAGIAAARPGGRVSDISHAVQVSLGTAGEYGIVDGYTGHGIGTALHMRPDVPNTGESGRGPDLVPGMVLAIEPMVTLGDPATDVLDDDWTVVTRDGSWAAHAEHTVAITAEGPVVLTALD